MKASSSSADVGVWQDLDGSAIQVQASVRQDSDAEWYVPGSEWKTQVLTKQNEIYLSTYVDMDENVWKTTFFYDGEQWGEGTWFFADAIAESEKQEEDKPEDKPEDKQPEDTFDPATIPNNKNGEGNEFEHAFQFDSGEFFVSNSIEVVDSYHFLQEIDVNNGGDATKVQIEYSYDYKNYEVQFKDLVNTDAEPVKVAMKTSVSSSSVGEFQQLVPPSDAVTV